MELQNEINNNVNIEKNNFLNTLLGKTINNAIDIGLKSILPDLIENQIIEIKDSLIKNGLKEGIQTAVDSTIDFGKSAIGIFTGNFENMTQVRTASAFLLRKGYSVTLYEKYNYLGGLLMHGIPEFRLPKEIVKHTIQKIIDLGLEVKYNYELGKNIELQELEKEYDAIFLAFGANITTKMGVEGEELQGIYGGNQLLEHQNHPDYTNKKVAIIGGGNVAMDCARTIKKLGAQEVKVIYRRAEEQMPAEQKEIQEAKQEGIEFLFQNNIVKILGKEKVEQVELIKTELVQKEGETRKVPVNIPDSNHIIDIDYIVMALGAMPESFVNDLGLELNKWGYINIDEKNRTSNPKIFAGGDIAGCKGTVAWAARSGRDAASRIIEHLEK